MNKHIRDYIISQKQPTLEEIKDLIKEHPVLNELELMVKHNLMTKQDSITMAFALLLSENTQLKMELYIKVMEEQKNGRQIAKFTGFK